MGEKGTSFRMTRSKLFAGVFILLGVYLVYKSTIGSNVLIRASTYYFYVEEVSEVKDVADTLKEKGIIGSRISFRLMSAILGLDNVRPGMYEIRRSWSNIHLVRHFENHKPKPTQFIQLPSMQLRNNMLRGLCKGSGVHYDDVWRMLNNKKFVENELGFNSESVFTMFIPGNYRVYKNIDSKQLLKRMKSEYLIFWNEERLEKAESIGLKPEEVMILSSIVYSETKLVDEMPIIAGVYINRLQKNMRLESDPTLIYAARKYGVKRVLKEFKNTDSPYNTYKRKGLPPGPISTVPTWVIDAVLDYDGHDYLYFCAKRDMNGEHEFAETYEEHLENARKYREKLDEEGIFN